jgi:polar amino acid transport system substrate-binding protein
VPPATMMQLMVMSREGSRLKSFARTALAILALSGPASAQRVAIPNFWDPRARAERPDVPATRVVRFLVDDDFPPFHFAGPDCAPTGFSVELARALCERLNLTCTVQARRFETLLNSLAEARGDAVAAAIPITADIRARFGATQVYFRNPARFAARRDRAVEPNPKALEGRSVGVVAGTAHEAYLRAFFPGVAARVEPDLVTALTSLRRGEVDLVFADGVGLARWVGGADSGDCCALVGGPYLESRFFGEGIGLLVRKDDDVLRRTLDYGLQQLWDEGKYAEIYLRFFPVSPF